MTEDDFGIPLLMEMANAIQKYTGLPGVVYFCTKEEMKNAQAHALGRVKWIHSGVEAFVSIRPDNDGKRKSGGDRRMVSQLEKFVIKNQDLLWEYWNTPAAEADSTDVIRKLIQVS